MQRRQMALQRAFPATSDRKERFPERVLRPPPSRRPNSNIDFLVYSLTIVVHLDVFLLAILNKKMYTFLIYCVSRVSWAPVESAHTGTWGWHVVSRFGVYQSQLVSRGVYSRKGK